MVFLVLAIYIATIFIRYHEVGGAVAPGLVRNLTLFAYFAYLLFEKDKISYPQLRASYWFAVVICLSCIFNGVVGTIPVEMIKYFSACLIPIVIVSSLIKTQKQQHIIMLICIVAALCMVHNGYEQFYSDIDTGWAGTKTVEGKRITYLGIFGDPNDIGMFLIMNIPFAFYFRHFCSFIRYLSYQFTRFPIRCPLFMRCLFLR